MPTLKHARSSDLDRLKQALKAAIADMSPEELARKPGPIVTKKNDDSPLKEKWSPAEILEHLDRTYTASSKAFEQCLEQKKPSATKGNLKCRVSALAVVGLGYLPRGRQAPKYAVPRGVAAAELPGLIEQHLAKMEELIRRCEVQFGEKTKIMDHPFIGPLSGRQWRKFHLVHGRHHIKQIQAIRAGLR